PAWGIVTEEILAIHNRVTIEELRHELDLLLGLGVDPNLHQRPARHFIMPKRLRVREQIAGRLPRYDLVNGDGLEELGAPKRRVSIGISFVGVVVAVASRQPLGDHWREAGDLPRRFVARSSLELPEESVLHRNAKPDRTQLQLGRRDRLARRRPGDSQRSAMARSGSPEA